MPNVFLGRQPILDSELNMFAFELLFRSGDWNSAQISDDFTATATVISHAFNEFGIEAALGPYRGFINVNESLLMSDVIEFLPKEKVVLEILETVKVTKPLVERCRMLKSAGFTLALDDVVEAAEEFVPLLDLVEIVKIDILEVESKRLAKLASSMKKGRIRLLAEKVDSMEQFDHCKSLGFELFQGYYFAKPQIIKGKRLSHSELTLMNLLGLVMSDADEAEIETVLKENPTLSINLLRLTNSVACGVGRRITSLRSAITVLGRRQMQRWIQILLYSGGQADENFPSPLLQLAATRGKIMEILSSKKDREFQDNAFMTGIMSLMDTLLGMPLPEILASLPVSREVEDALARRSGELGKLLDLVETLEKGCGEDIVACIAEHGGLSLNDLNAAQMEALQWTNDMSKTDD